MVVILVSLAHRCSIAKTAASGRSRGHGAAAAASRAATALDLGLGAPRRPARPRRPVVRRAASVVALEPRRDRLGLRPALAARRRRFLRSPSARPRCRVGAVRLGRPLLGLFAARRWARASVDRRPPARCVISDTERIASSLPAIGTVIRSGSALVSTIATTGMPSLFASVTAIFSFLESTTNSSAGQAVHVLDAREVAC